MNCPNCGSTMTIKVFENQNILHCENCGGNFFEENGINRITISDAERLAKDKQTDEVSGAKKHCLKDNVVMKVMRNEENIPVDVTILQCPECKSIFVFADDLLRFKQAQEAKIDYFKAWSMPLPSLSAVVVMSVVAVIAAVIYSRTIYFQNTNITTTKAESVIKNIYASKSGQYIFVSFNTSAPTTAYVYFKDMTTGKTMLKTVSSRLTTVHYMTTGDFNTNDQIFYTIIIRDKAGKEVKSEEKKL